VCNVLVQNFCNAEGNVKIIVSRTNLFEESFQQVMHRLNESVNTRDLILSNWPILAVPRTVE